MELTEKHLKIPYVIANKYAEANTEFFEELVAEGNLYLVKAVQTYQEGHGTRLETWLYGTVSRYVLRYQMQLKGKGNQRLAKYNRMKRVPFHTVARETYPHPEDLAYAYHVLHLLTEEERRLFLWRHQEELSYEEIGKRIGVNRVTARLRVLKIHRWLENYRRDSGCE